MNKKTNPFNCVYSTEFAELLHKLKISLAISTPQAGKVIFLSATDDKKIIQLPRTFDYPTGIAVRNDSIAIACENELLLLRNSSNSALSYPKNKDTYDAIFIPRASYYTGKLSMHDIEINKDNKIMGVNTLFSCICTIDDKYNFTPIWQPPFISELNNEDRCHLNGMAIQNGEIKYVTALGKSNLPKGWETNRMTGGIIMEYPSGKIIAQDLGMPHSPRIYDNKLYVLNSTQGELLQIDTKSGKREIVCKIGGFLRGMSKIENYLFIGSSKLRYTDETSANLPISKSSFAGIVVVDLKKSEIVAKLEYTASIKEISDLKILPDFVRPSLLSPNSEIHKHSIVMPQKVIWIKENKTQNIDNKTNNYKYQFIKKITKNEIYTKYKNLVFPFFMKKLEKSIIKGSMSAITCWYHSIPVGMLIIEVKANRIAELHSIVVGKKFQNKGIAENMLKLLDKIMRQFKFNYIDIVYFNNLNSRKTLEKLLQKDNWQKPMPTTMNIKIESKSAWEMDWLQKAYNHKDDEITIFDWKDLTKNDITEIKNILENGKCPRYLTPFQIQEQLNLKISKGVRINGKIAGWCIIHNISQDTAQCSALYVEPQYRRKNIDKILIAYTTKTGLDENIKFANFQVQYSDKLTTRYLKSLFSKSEVLQNINYDIASRKYF